jgi:hypothetical protein
MPGEFLAQGDGRIGIKPGSIIDFLSDKPPIRKLFHVPDMAA